MAPESTIGGVPIEPADEQHVVVRHPGDATGRDVEPRLASELAVAGHTAAIYRGEMEKAERRSNLADFREGRVKLMVATVRTAPRGLRRSRGRTGRSE